LSEIVFRVPVARRVKIIIIAMLLDIYKTAIKYFNELSYNWTQRKWYKWQNIILVGNYKLPFGTLWWYGKVPISSDCHVDFRLGISSVWSNQVKKCLKMPCCLTYIKRQLNTSTNCHTTEHKESGTIHWINWTKSSYNLKGYCLPAAFYICQAAWLLWLFSLVWPQGLGKLFLTNIRSRAMAIS
jgi:hypothetical protein